MSAMALSIGQRWLLEQLGADGARVWRSPKAYQMARPIGPWFTLTEDTVMQLVAWGFLRQVESYGRVRGLYEISEQGRLAIASIHA